MCVLLAAATVWCTLAISGLYPHLLPSAALEPCGSLRARLCQTLVGLVGLAGVGQLKNAVGRSPAGMADGRKGALKALTYVAICAWTFLLSQRAWLGVLWLLGRVGVTL